MSVGHNHRGRTTTVRLCIAALVLGTASLVSAAPAGAATTASFNLGVLTVTGDANNNVISVSRNAAGNILVNGGAVAVAGGTPTVANTSTILVIGGAGNDTISLDEANGALPRATLIGSAGNDVLTGGSGNDSLVGQAGNDTLLGKGGFDMMFGGADNDVLTGGDADDQAFGEGGNDRMIWNPGDDTDLNEGGDGNDTTEVNGGIGDEQFAATANGLRVRFDRLNPAPFSIDMGTVEVLLLQANGGADSFSASGNLAALIVTVVNGGAGNDTILGTNGSDWLIGDSGNDFIDGQQGNDLVMLGSDNDVFQWDPGDGNDTVEGQSGTDTMLFNGSNIAETFDASANGPRVRFLRNVGNIVMDLNDVEQIELHALGETDNVVVNDLSGTDVTNVAIDLAGAGGVDDNAADNVVVNATNGDDVAVIAGQGSSLQVAGLHTAISITGAGAATDRLTLNMLGGDDVVEASSVAAGSAALTMNGDTGNDVLIGGDGNDTLAGGDDDDVLIGGPGVDVLDGGAGDNVLFQ